MLEEEAMFACTCTWLGIDEMSVAELGPSGLGTATFGRFWLKVSETARAVIAAASLQVPCLMNLGTWETVEVLEGELGIANLTCS